MSAKATRPFWRRAIKPLFFTGLGLFLFATLVLDFVVRHKFEGTKWGIPAKVYAKPSELYQGQVISRAQVEELLQILGYRAVKSPTGPGQYARTNTGISFYARGFAFNDAPEPRQPVQLHFAGNSLQAIETAQGEQALMRLEPLLIGSIYPGDHEDRLLISQEEIPELLAQTLLATEDRNFREHHGVSFKGIARAFMANVEAGATVQGGSTITQQLVKNFYLSSERTLTRKLQEVWMAGLLELHYSKDEILEAYLNEVFLGQDGGRAIHGFGLASRHFFRQPLAELDLPQIALLVGMVKGPSYYDPWRHPERALERRNVVLGLLKEQQIIDEAQYQAAIKQPLGTGKLNSGNRLARIGTYPAFLDLVRRQVTSDYGDEQLLSQGLHIFTTLDPLVQHQVERAVSQGVARLEKGYPKLDKKLQAAAVVTNPANGQVLAVLGDRAPQYRGFNRALDARRPVGSLLKPLVVLTALESGRYTLASGVQDTAFTLPIAGSKPWQPENYDGREHGQVTLYRMLVNSYNLSTARVGVDVGPERLLDAIKRTGAEGDMKAVPSLILGAGGMSPFDMAKVYQALAADGFVQPLRAITDVFDAEMKPLKRYQLETEQRFDSAYVQQVRWAMTGVVREGTARSVAGKFNYDAIPAGKTGTTDSQRDSWFAGFNGNYNAVVWLGRDDNERTPLTGATGALPIWADFLSQLPQAPLPELNQPSIQWYWNADGYLTDLNCPGARNMPLDNRNQLPPYRSCHTESSIMDQLRQFADPEASSQPAQPAGRPQRQAPPAGAEPQKPRSWRDLFWR